MRTDVPADLARRLANPAQSAPISPASDENLLHVLRGATVAMVRSDAPDLSARQLGVFLTVILAVLVYSR